MKQKKDFDYLIKVKSGIPKAQDYPRKRTKGKCLKNHEKVDFKVTGYEHVNTENLLDILDRVGPLAVVIGRPPYSYKGGIIDDDADICNGTSVNHAVLLVGYDKESFIFKNSWSQK